MSISVKKLLEINKLIDFQKLKWGEISTTNSEGVYIVSLSDVPGSITIIDFLSHVFQFLQTVSVPPPTLHPPSTANVP